MAVAHLVDKPNGLKQMGYDYRGIQIVVERLITLSLKSINFRRDCRIILRLYVSQSPPPLKHTVKSLFRRLQSLV